MGRKTSEDWITLPQALDRATKVAPLIAQTALRRMVEAGEIPHKRSSKKKGARYFVEWSVFLEHLDNLSEPVGI